MKKTSILFALFTVFGGVLIAQSPDLAWANSIGGPGGDVGNSIAIDVSGNTFTTGGFADTTDFDPGPGTFNLISNGGTDIFVQKLNANGDLDWAVSMGGTALDVGRGISTDASGNVYITGEFVNTVDFDPSGATFDITETGGREIFILKLDANGNFVWAKSIEGTTWNFATTVYVDASDNVIVMGSFSGDADFDPGVAVFNMSVVGVFDPFILKLDAQGDFMWVNFIQATTNKGATAITTDPSGSIYIAGHFQSTVDFDPGTGIFNMTSAGSQDIFIQKVDANGVFVWAISTGGTGTEASRGITADAVGNLYLTGSYTDTVDFDPGAGVFDLTALGSVDVFVQKLDTGGNFIWAKSIGGTAPEDAAAIMTDVSGNVYVTGRFGGTADLDPGSGFFNVTANGGDDIFVLKLNSTGDFGWATAMGNVGPDQGRSIAVDASSNIYITGVYRDTVDFDPSGATFNLISNNGSDDVFVLKLSQCTPSSGTDIITACNAHTWIDGNIYTASNITAMYAMTGGAANGCDSIVTLNLTIDTVDVSVTVNDPSMTANELGATYRWLDCSNNFAVISGATAQNFIPMGNGDYAVEITLNGCTDTSACTTVTMVGIEPGIFFKRVSINPNPTQGLLTIDLGQLQDVTVNVFGINGQLIDHQEHISNGGHQIMLEGATGIYVIEIKTKGQAKKYRVIKEQ
ncbi:MAG: T9SS type A sorting domain-containing protein [Flavobacteriales bacterium]|nr:T9SS type A sorting domain-containing protein [Flavobacteriales bacterium]